MLLCPPIHIAVVVIVALKGFKSKYKLFQADFQPLKYADVDSDVTSGAISVFAKLPYH